MYYGRVEQGLETPVPAEDQAQLDIDSLQANCSEVTFLVAVDFEEEIVTTGFDVEELENQRTYLKDIANWLNDNVSP